MTLPDWETPSVIHRHREPAHAPLASYPSAADALAGRTPWVRSLDGTWRFHLAANPASAPADMHRPDFDDRGWSGIAVPSTWQMPGVTDLEGLDRPIYLNITYPFPIDPLVVPRDDNPTGCYRTSFELPDAWRARRTTIVFGGVDSAFHCWLNGVEIGFSTDSRLPAEFNLTPHLKPGRNVLAVRCYRWSHGSFLEDQDMWRLAGIQRSVRLVSKPRIRIADLRAVTLPDARYEDWTLGVATRVVGGDLAAIAKHRVSAQLYDAQGQAVFAEPLVATPSHCSKPAWAQAHDDHAVVERVVKAPKRWSAETPDLYRLVVELRDGDGAVVEAETCRVGFRSVELKDGVCLVNGRRVVFTGVNRHEFDHERGKTIGDEQMLADIRALKRANINAVRLSHYPNDERWYDLCDEHGLYVVDEANIETHGLKPWDRLARDPEWAGAMLARLTRMVERDKNHPCVVFWSLGNESGYGPNHDAMAQWARRMDRTRLVHYETCGDGPATDVFCPMYPVPARMAEWSARDHSRPMILCEYSHAMGNSCGNLHEYWRLIWGEDTRTSIHYERILPNPRLQGGFIWDWADQGIRVRAPDGRAYWAYGGDFGEKVHDATFCNNGIVFPDRSPHPAYHEVAWCYQKVSARWAEAAGGEIEIRNRHAFTDLATLRATWRLLHDGDEAARGELALPQIAPGAGARVACPTLPAASGVERTLVIELALRAATAWADAGFIVARDQLALPAVAPAARPAPSEARATARPTGDHVIVDAAGVRVRIDRTTGALVGLARDGVQRLASPLRHQFWRAPVDNDLGGGASSYAAAWAKAGLDRLVERCLACAVDETVDGVRVTARQRIAADGVDVGFDAAVTYLVRGDGSVVVDVLVEADPRLPTLPRVGVALDVADAFGEAAWYGRGPHENYPDRRSSAFLARHRLAVDALATPYIHPTENGGRGDVRWWALTDAGGAGVVVAGDAPLQVAAHRCTPADWAAAKHTVDVPRRDAITWSIDHRHQGVGGDVSWTPCVHAPYLVPPGRFAYRLVFAALAAGEDPGRRWRQGLVGLG